MCHAPQERRWFAFRISRLHTAGAPRFLVCHDNVTPQGRAEEQARINEARYQAVFSGVGDAILVSDAHGNHLDANPAAEKLLGNTRQELLGSSLQDLTLPSPERVRAGVPDSDRNVARRTRTSPRGPPGDPC